MNLTYLICLYYDGWTLRMVSVPLPTVTLIDMNKLALIIIIENTKVANLKQCTYSLQEFVRMHSL